MTSEQVYALQLLRSHPGRWVRPANNARLLAYLTLAVRGWAIASEDDNGFRFQLAEPKNCPAFNVVEYRAGDCADRRAKSSPEAPTHATRRGFPTVSFPTTMDYWGMRGAVE
jgi:hypothetical protein